MLEINSRHKVDWCLADAPSRLFRDPRAYGITARLAWLARNGLGCSMCVLRVLCCGVLQVLRYGLGQEYKPHMDTLKDNDAGPRVCTVLMYLNGTQPCL